jgi:nitrogen fixation protein FixH
MNTQAQEYASIVTEERVVDTPTIDISTIDGIAANHISHIHQRKRSTGKTWMFGIIGVYALFALATLGWVGFTMTQKVELVSPSYYQQEVAYQQRIDNAKRAMNLPEPLQWRLVSDAQGERILEITYPKDQLQQGAVQGTITFLRPASLTMDKTVRVQPDAQGKQRIPLAAMDKGLWKVSIEWHVSGVGYYKETDLKL